MKKKIVVIGGGFAGLNLVKHLARASEFHVTLVDMNNYNFFPPLLYQVATSFLEVSNICYPFRKLFHDKNISFRLARLEKILPEENTIILSNGMLSYDHLVLATGTKSNYFGMENIRMTALPMKTVDDAIEIRNHMLQIAEEASITTDRAEKRKLATIVIAGGGPTGVEIAGVLAEMRETILEKDYPELTAQHVRICLVDGEPALLASMSEQSQRYAREKLEEMGVEVHLNKRVEDYIDDKVVFADSDSIEARTLLWTAGVTATVYEGIPPESYGRGSRLIVNEYNEVTGIENIYAIGDTCIMTSDPEFPNGHPQVAQVALQQGKNMAHNFTAAAHGDSMVPFTYVDKGSLAIIGRSKAVADLPKPKMHFNGLIAWITWLFVHLFSLITYRNRLMTLLNWAAAYFTKDQSLRMIVRPDRKS